MILYREFEQLAKSYNVVPIIRTMLADLHTPVSTYLSVREPEVPSFLFESVVPGERIGRYSFIGLRPIVLVRVRGRSVTIFEGGTNRTSQGSVFDTMTALTSRYRQAPVHGHQGFTGGVVGYLGYDCVRHLERLPLADPAPSDTDDAVAGLFSTVIRFDHLRQPVAIIVNVVVECSRFRKNFRANQLAQILLVTPTTTPRRIEAIDALSSGFLYCVSTTGVTGSGSRAPAQVYLRTIRRHARKNPVLVGFGVSTPRDAAALAAHADGVIVGSALITEIAKGGSKRSLTEWVREIKSALR